ncbi:splicing factor 3B subunit 5 [Dictyostelium discoideum AX4]|uniref:Splicing factor 3B subunit 5 n=1 Tax=Dictyostelium discoideum TaxID=44689 RepID=SF3B5_DICDI|nr:splicing factor 3B subunit 5 [Dictyostelium discoideum AX4]Q55BF5.1 RecName: Full=Splicing factor 3B subunit 5; Short=SF3b5; AltName: Full=Pre-mRNA-splicing factor SF3b 10 kDa subunit homolog [Dictyostelium discoideum]EAL71786.1 splicing factor 3B subunit 5 [Dictyostelium discoideum AX4]|eukprot:XP_645657.1 splicing factor 3B subunit 5 [Dictyostelium discoideum AX4]
MSERESLNSQLEHLQMRYVGTGHADISKHEWLTNQHRDSLSSFIGHSSFLSLFSIAENESVGRVRYNTLTKMISPCGPAPKIKDNTMDKEEKND